MDRRAFFKELARSLTETGKEVLTPIIEHDLEKLDRASDLIQGLRWQPINQPSQGYSEQVVNHSLIGLYVSKEEALAFDKKCAVCHTLLQWLAYDQQLHCLMCDQSYSFMRKEGALAPSFYTLKHDQRGWSVAVPE